MVLSRRYLTSKLLYLWENLDADDRKVIIAMLFDVSPELARRNLKLNRRLFYDRWKHLKPFYFKLLDNLPARVIKDFRSYAGKLNQF